ncbi:MAG: WecB/TagA/CpsF family glycosyltransferase [Spirochaetaceae bacterium]|nr:WecB/TagA/CpsF family glycosyltransferase [Spirochaetaceae bacterium]
MRNIQLFGFDIYCNGAEKCIAEIKSRAGKIHIISGNAEVLKYPLADKGVYALFKQIENIIIPDGISVYYPAKRKNKACKKIPGIELMQLLLEEYSNSGKSVYFLGAKKSVIENMIPKIRAQFPRLMIAGHHHGYFDKNNCHDIIDNIKESKAHALFAALGTPAQERFIFEYMNQLPCSLFMGVGGSFDVLSGAIKRSPKWMRLAGLEWLYRLLRNPSKISRIQNNIAFIIKAFLFG